MTSQRPDSGECWRDKHVIVTGGAGFLGSFVFEKLEERGAVEIMVPRSKDYDLRDLNAIRQLFHDVGLSNPKSEILIHLPAASEPLRPTRQLRPGEFPRDPGTDPQVH